jgi:mRNA interferase MazF
VTRQGDIFWVDFGVPRGSEPGYLRPAVVIQNNVFNKSNISTVVVCLLTTNLRRQEDPGNVPLVPGEGNLDELSVANVSQIFTVDKADLSYKVGSLNTRRVEEIVSGIHLLLDPADINS